jgi:hypothetical protein
MRNQPWSKDDGKICERHASVEAVHHAAARDSEHRKARTCGSHEIDVRFSRENGEKIENVEE